MLPTVIEMKTAVLRPRKYFLFDKPVRSVAFFPDGKRIAAAGHLDGAAHIWNLQTGKEEGVPLKAHNRPITKLVISEDGNKIITGGQDHRVFLWNISDMQKPILKQLFGGPSSGQTDFLTFSLSKNIPGLITSTSKALIKSWKIYPEAKEATRLSQIPIHTTTVNLVSLSNASLNLMAVVCGKKAVKVFDAQSGEQYTELDLYPGSIRCLEWFPNSKRIISTAHSSIYITDGRRNKWITSKIEGHNQSIRAVDVHPEGRIIASGGEDKTLRVWDTETGAQIGCSKEEMGAITSLAFSPDGNFVLSVSRGKHAFLWDVTGLGVPCRSKGTSQDDALTHFFSHYKKFEYDPKRDPTSEFARLCRHLQWDQAINAKNQAEKAFVKALKEQFNAVYGINVDGLKKYLLRYISNAKLDH